MTYIFTIDGVDGAGKSTVSKAIQKRLEHFGIQTTIISPPFYDTPTGTIVTDYLQKGYGDITDRWVASQLYSFDRNMWMKENFSKVFGATKVATSSIEEDGKRGRTFNGIMFTDKPDRVIIYNRNWISNMLYQTTLEVQTSDDEGSLCPYIMNIPCDGANLFTMKQCFDLLNGNMHEVPEKMVELYRESEMIRMNVFMAATIYRTTLVNRMIHHLFSMEIEPWRAMPNAHQNIREQHGMYSLFYPINFIRNAAEVCNIVLTPDADSYRIIYQNMRQRYGGDLSKMDRNERSELYMGSVIENIKWINLYWDMICANSTFSQETNKIYRTLSREYTHFVSDEELTPTPLGEDEKRAFSYHIVKTTENHIQKSKEEMADEVWSIMRPHLQPLLARMERVDEDA